MACIMCLDNEPTIHFECCYRPGAGKCCCYSCLRKYVINEVSSCVYANGDIVIRCPLCRVNLEKVLYHDYNAMSLEMFFDIELIIDSCKVCLYYKDESARQERFLMRTYLRNDILPPLLRLAAIRRN